MDVLIPTSKKGQISERVGVFLLFFWGGGCIAVDHSHHSCHGLPHHKEMLLIVSYVQGEWHSLDIGTSFTFRF